MTRTDALVAAISAGLIVVGVGIWSIAAAMIVAGVMGLVVTLCPPPRRRKE